MIRVFVADDHPIVRDGLRRLFAETSDIVLAGETHKGREVLDRAASDAWDVLVLDLSLEDIGGIEVLRRLREQAPRLPVIVLSMYPEDQYALRILKMGAFAYLSKGRSSAELLDAIRAASQGRRYLTPEVADSLLSPGSATAPAIPHDRLSEREHQVFLLIAEGLSSGEIATQLDLSPSTVSSHLVHIREKLGVRNTGEIIGYAFRAKLTGRD